MTKKSSDQPTGDVEIKTPVVYTLPQLAKKLGIHRVTLMRMEQRGVLEQAKWAGPPVNGRVYTEEDAREVEKRYLAYWEKKYGERLADAIAGGREIVEKFKVAE